MAARSPVVGRDDICDEMGWNRKELSGKRAEVANKPVTTEDDRGGLNRLTRPSAFARHPATLASADPDAHVRNHPFLFRSSSFFPIFPTSGKVAVLRPCFTAASSPSFGASRVKCGAWRP